MRRSFRNILFMRLLTATRNLVLLAAALMVVHPTRSLADFSCGGSWCDTAMADNFDGDYCGACYQLCGDGNFSCICGSYWCIDGSSGSACGMCGPDQYAE